MKESVATLMLYHLSDYLRRYYGKKVIIFLDEYETLMQEAYVNCYCQDWLLLPEVCLIPLLKLILICSVG